MQACYDDAKCDVKVDTEKYGPDCGTTVGAILYFCSFIFLCMFLVSNVRKIQHQWPPIHRTGER